MKTHLRRLVGLIGKAVAAAERSLADEGMESPDTLVLRVYQAQRARLPPAKRMRFTPSERAMVLTAMRRCGQGPAWVAAQFLVDVRTVRRWIAEERTGSTSDADTVAHNRHCDEVRLAVHGGWHGLGVMASLRKVAFAMNRHGIQMGVETVRRILMEEQPKRKPGKSKTPKGEAQTTPKNCEVAPAVEPFGPLRPEKPNQVWHVDFTERGFWRLRRFVVGVVDGCSRKILASRWFVRTPTAEDTLALVEELAAKHGKPEAVCTDHGGQFKGVFRKGLFALGITHARGRPGNPKFNGKVERFFKTLKQDLFGLLPLVLVKAGKAQVILNDHAGWFNRERPHLALGGLTPEEVWNGVKRRPPVAYRARDKLRVRIKTTRTNRRGLSCCPVLHFEVTVNHQAA